MIAGFVVTHGAGSWLSGLSLGLRKRKGTRIEWTQDIAEVMLFDTERTAMTFAAVVSNESGDPHGVAPHAREPQVVAPKPAKAEARLAALKARVGK